MAKYILGLCVILLVGCATFEERQRLDSLEKTLNLYKNAIRWGSYERAIGFGKEKGREVKKTDFERLRKIKVSAYTQADCGDKVLSYRLPDRKDAH
jgi:hypothetical protein